MHRTPRPFRGAETGPAAPTGGAYGRAYPIQSSPDNSTWTTVHSTTTGDGDDDVTLTGTGRYVRVNGTQRGLAPYGYSLWEFEVHGS